MVKPTITWDNGRTKTRMGKEEEADWARCTVCGKESLVFLDKDKRTYVCKSCKAEKEGLVSMRCFRHKKRFNVPEWWVKVSNSLCPSCYDRLSNKERNDYKRKDGWNSVLERVDGIRTIFPSKGKDSYLDSVVKKAVRDKDERSRGEKRNPALESVLPLHRIGCKKCGEVVPCHSSWFEKSTVLCPACYFSMTEFDIRKFNEENKANNSIKGLDREQTKAEKETKDWTRNAALVNRGGRMTNSRILEASEEELKRAVREGLLSEARMRIELNRRANTEYFDFCPKEYVTVSLPNG